MPTGTLSLSPKYKGFSQSNFCIVTFRIHYSTRLGQRLCITGETEAFGKWSPQRARLMNYTKDGIWEFTFIFAENSPASFRYSSILYAIEICFRYKYLVVNNDDWVLYEDGPQRVLQLSELQKHNHVLVQDQWRVSL